MPDQFELLHEIIIALQQTNGQHARISTSTIDSIFGKIEQELSHRIKHDAEISEYITTYKIIIRTQLQQTETALAELKRIKDLNDTQFYQYIRLKKIQAGIIKMLIRYEEIMVKTA